MAKKNNADFLDQVGGGAQVPGGDNTISYTINPDTNFDNVQDDPLVMFNGELMNESIMEKKNQPPYEVDTISRRIYRSSKDEFFKEFPDIGIYGYPPIGLNKK